MACLITFPRKRCKSLAQVGGNLDLPPPPPPRMPVANEGLWGSRTVLKM